MLAYVVQTALVKIDQGAVQGRGSHFAPVHQSGNDWSERFGFMFHSGVKVRAAKGDAPARRGKSLAKHFNSFSRVGLHVPQLFEFGFGEGEAVGDAELINPARVSQHDPRSLFDKVVVVGRFRIEGFDFALPVQGRLFKHVACKEEEEEEGLLLLLFWMRKN